MRSLDESIVEKVKEIRELPEHVTRDTDDIMKENISWQEVVEQSPPFDEESDRKEEFYREVKHREASIGNEALKDPFFLPCFVIC